MLCTSPCSPAGCIQQPYSSETWTALPCLLNSRRNCGIQFCGSLVPPKTLMAYALPSLFTCWFFQAIRYVHRHPKQRPLFFYSDWRYDWDEDVLGVVIKGDHPSDRKTMDSKSILTDFTVQRVGGSVQAFAVGWCTLKAQTCYLGDEDFHTKFGQWRREQLYFVAKEFSKVSITVLRCIIRLSKKGDIVL